MVVFGSLTATALGITTLSWSDGPRRLWLTCLGYLLLWGGLGMFLFLQLFQPMSVYGGIVVPSHWLALVATTVLGLLALKWSAPSSARSRLRCLGYVLLWAALSFLLYMQLLEPLFLYALLVAPSYSFALLGIVRYTRTWRAHRDKERMDRWLQ